jgi:hypothetical protein
MTITHARTHNIDLLNMLDALAAAALRPFPAAPRPAGERLRGRGEGRGWAGGLGLLPESPQMNRLVQAANAPPRSRSSRRLGDTPATHNRFRQSYEQINQSIKQTNHPSPPGGRQRPGPDQARLIRDRARSPARPGPGRIRIEPGPDAPLGPETPRPIRSCRYDPAPASDALPASRIWPASTRPGRASFDPGRAVSDKAGRAVLDGTGRAAGG